MQDFELKNVKGTFDFLPEEQIIRNKITNTLRDSFELYGYLPLETPIICYYDLLASKYAGGSEILKEVYKLEDQGKRKLGLRYDLTVPFSKVIGMMKEPVLPFKRYEIGKVFRDGPVKMGRNREFYQCDVDVCGVKDISIEAELFSMTVYAYTKLGIDIEIKYNNRKLLSGLILECGIKEDIISNVILIIDKLEKISKKELYFELNSIGVNEIIADKLFSCFSLSLEEIKDKYINTNNELLKQGIEEILELNAYLEGMNIIKYTSFKPFLARGLEIYTGTVWEIFDKKNRITSSLGGGGRYDKIITNFINDGNIYPAVGMSFGLEPIYTILKEENIKTPLYDLYIFPFEMSPEILNIAQTLRQSGIKVIVEMNRKKIKKGLDFANRNNIPYVIIVGEDEIKTNTYSLKNMLTGEQRSLSLEEIVKELKNEN